MAPRPPPPPPCTMDLRVPSDLDLAHRIADTAAAIALRHFAPAVAFTSKVDGSPVTAADLEIDDAVVALLRAERPDDAVLSEESGATGQGRRRWIIDPLDGTSAFLRGGAGWGTYVALEEDGVLVLGLVDHPVDRHRYHWVAGGGPTRATDTADGARSGTERAVRVSDVDRLEDARFMAWPRRETPALHALRAVATEVEPTMDFLVDLLEGRIDVLVSQGGDTWDHAAEVAVVEGAGGRFRDPRGGRRLDLRGGTYTNAALEGPVGALLGRF
jgi:histidinol-phosphatase